MAEKRLIDANALNWGRCPADAKLIKAWIDEAPTINAGLRWTSVESELPPVKIDKFHEYIVQVERSHWPTSSYDPCDAPYSETYVTAAQYDSEQKIWHLHSDQSLNALISIDDAPLNGDYVTLWMEMPTIQSTAYDWHEIPEDLPEIGADVLMSFADKGNMAVGWLNSADDGETRWSAYTDGGWFTDCEYAPSHWMALPQKPVERSDND